MRPNQQAAIATLHGILQRADRIADEHYRPDELAARISEFDAFAALVCSQLSSPASIASGVAALHQAGVSWATLAPAFAAMRQDIVEPTLIATTAELDAYCDAVAGAPGRAILQIAGCPEALIEPISRELGRAVQKTNILRDVEADARDGRRYIPNLATNPCDIAHHFETGECAYAFPAILDLAAQADQHYALSVAASRQCPRSVRVLVGNIVIAYRGILAALRSRCYATGTLGPTRKASIAMRIVIRSLLMRLLPN